MVHFVNTRKNFLDAQKLSGRQRGHADEVFGTLWHASMALELYGKNACKCWRIFSFGGILCVFLPFAWCISIYWDGLLGGMAGVVGLGWRICCPGILDNVYVSWDCVVVVLHDNLRMCSLRYVFYSQAISYYVLWMKKCASIKKCAYSTVWLTSRSLVLGPWRTSTESRKI